MPVREMGVTDDAAIGATSFALSSSPGVLTSSACSSPHNTHARRNAPTLTAMSATLNVGHRMSPIPMSMKSTTPCADRMRSIRLPIAPPHTSAIASRADQVAVPRGAVEPAENEQARLRSAP